MRTGNEDWRGMPTVHVPNEQNTEPADPTHPTLPCTRHSGMVTRPLLDQKGQGQPQEWWSLDDVHPWPMSCPGPSWQGEPDQAPVSTAWTTQVIDNSVALRAILQSRLMFKW